MIANTGNNINIYETNNTVKIDIHVRNVAFLLTCLEQVESLPLRRTRKIGKGDRIRVLYVVASAIPKRFFV
jgi:hypothetical protein